MVNMQSFLIPSHSQRLHYTNNHILSARSKNLESGVYKMTPDSDSDDMEAKMEDVRLSSVSCLTRLVVALIIKLLDAV